MNVLVTGGNGFLGRAIVEQLLARGDSVRALGRGDYPELRALGVRCFRADLADSSADLAPALRGCEVVFHVAAKAGVWGGWHDFYRNNVSATQRVLRAAVRAGVPVLGANLPRTRMREAMADATLDARLPPAALAAQQQAIRDGHCGLLPETQITPMARIQIARDIRMAHALERARLPGKTVVLVAGSGHVLRDRGVPVHLATGITARVLLLQAGGASGAVGNPAQADLVLPTPALPPTDYCAGLRKQFAPRPSPQ